MPKCELVTNSCDMGFSYFQGHYYQDMFPIDGCFNDQEKSIN